MALTTYLVLERISVVGAQVVHVDAEPVAEEVTAFIRRGAVNAHSTEQAIRKAGENYGAGHYAVVSERSWKEETLEVETTTKVRVKAS